MGRSQDLVVGDSATVTPEIETTPLCKSCIKMMDVFNSTESPLKKFLLLSRMRYQTLLVHQIAAKFIVRYAPKTK